MGLPVAQDYFTARELAEIAAKRGLACFPATKRGVNDLARREGWDQLPSSLARRRTGREGGGGTEYHRSLLPERMQAAIARYAVQSELQAAHDVQAEADRRQMAALRASTLGAHARAVMQARAEILTSIEGYGISQGQTRAWAVARFLEAQDAARARQEIEARRDRDAILTEREAASLSQPLLLTAAAGFALTSETLATANDRRGAPKVSRSTLYQWFKTRDERGPVALAPTPTKAAQPIPPGFAGFLRHYAIGSKPSAADALDEYMKEVTDPALALTIDQVRHTLRAKLNNIEKHIGRDPPCRGAGLHHRAGDPAARAAARAVLGHDVRCGRSPRAGRAGSAVPGCRAGVSTGTQGSLRLCGPGGICGRAPGPSRTWRRRGRWRTPPDRG